MVPKDSSRHKAGKGAPKGGSRKGHARHDGDKDPSIEAEADIHENDAPAPEPSYEPNPNEHHARRLMGDVGHIAEHPRQSSYEEARWRPPAWDRGIGRGSLEKRGPTPEDSRDPSHEHTEHWRPPAWEQGIAVEHPGAGAEPAPPEEGITAIYDPDGTPLDLGSASSQGSKSVADIEAKAPSQGSLEARVQLRPPEGTNGGSGGEELNEEDAQAEWGEQARSEPRWPASLAVLGAMLMYIALPDKVAAYLGPRWLIPALEGALAAALLIAAPRIQKRSARLRSAAIALIAIINFANVMSLVELINALLYGNRAGGRALVISSVPIWLTNVIVFALWYWELDRGGPAARLLSGRREPDFLFPQMSSPYSTKQGWSPSFLDYVYTSFTNATAFSPTDTMPLTAWAKLLMLVQAFASLLTVALVISRAVNILS